MLGIVVILALSWLLLHFTVGRNLSVLGVTPPMLRLLQFILGFLLLSFLSGLTLLLDSWLYQTQWQQSFVDYLLIFQSFWYHLKSALTEDLVFRGAILYVLIRKIGPVKAIVLSAVVFGIYHWFSYGMLEGEVRIIPLLYVFLLTGLIGLSWAYTYHKTQSILMPLGMHVGSNFTMSLFLTNQPYGELLYQQTAVTPFDNEWIQLFYLLIKAVILPLIIITTVHYYTKFYDKQNLSNLDSSES